MSLQNLPTVELRKVIQKRKDSFGEIRIGAKSKTVKSREEKSTVLSDSMDTTVKEELNSTEKETKKKTSKEVDLGDVSENKNEGLENLKKELKAKIVKSSNKKAKAKITSDSNNSKPSPIEKHIEPDEDVKESNSVKTISTRMKEGYFGRRRR